MKRLWLLPLLALFAGGCASKRVLRIENQLLRSHVTELEQQLADAQEKAPAPDDYARKVDLDVIDRFLTRAGLDHELVTTGNPHVKLSWSGRNATFGVNIQVFPAADIVFLATDDYLELQDATSTESVVLLLVQLASLNYDLLVGKFQLNPETGDILLSSELHVDDGLGYHTLIAALDHLCSTADARKPDLERAIEGLGL